MRATGSRAYLGELSATYQEHHRGDTFRDNYYDEEGWWVLTWIRAYRRWPGPPAPDRPDRPPGPAAGASVGCG
jgi:hypothetical protein